MTTEEKIAHIFPAASEIPEAHRLSVPLEQTKYLIGGKLIEWPGEKQNVYSPVCIKGEADTEPQRIGSYPKLTETESLAALDAATAAYNNGRGEWPTMSVRDRITHIENFVRLMRGKREEVVRLLMWEIGKTFADSQREFDRTVDYILATIEAVKNLDRDSSRFVIEEGIIGQIRRSPLGVTLCMGPFNYPLNETYTILIPALIMGNPVIFKPPKYGVLLHQPLLDAFREAFPAGVVNTVYGEGRVIVPPLMASGKISILAFIGSSRVVDSLKKQHPKVHRLRSVLGLDAKNVGVVLPDADLKLAVKECILGTLSYNGQRCTALKLLFVHQNIADEFLKQFSEAVGKLKIGMPWEEGAVITPVAEQHKTDYLTELVKDAEAFGGKVMNEHGGKVNHTFFYPAVVYPVNEKMRLYREEQFGPVVPVIPFSDISTPIDYIIESNYGQQMSIFGSDANEIASLIDPLVNQVCRVNINSQCQRGPDVFPFTGRKDSAEGTLSVTDALRAFSIRTLVAAKGTDINKNIITEIVRDHKSAFLSTDFIL
ncbi:MAG: NADP-dependent glyceraldehyde-3-phosphate dehydrogenase [Rhizobacter sp.]|nr:NADP-dependent glyceraldehyde-3-phosphate dehydrogenase [Chlorobiales bacterium]